MISIARKVSKKKGSGKFNIQNYKQILVVVGLLVGVGIIAWLANNYVSFGGDLFGQAISATTVSVRPSSSSDVSFKVTPWRATSDAQMSITTPSGETEILSGRDARRYKPREEGTHSFTLESPGYETAEGSFTIKSRVTGKITTGFRTSLSGARITIRLAKQKVVESVYGPDGNPLDPALGYVQFVSEPSGMTVTLNGEEVGQTPLYLKGINPGNNQLYRIQEKLTDDRSYYDYNSESGTVDVKAGEVTTVNVELQRITGSIQVNSNPSGATVELGGTNRGATPVQIDHISTVNPIDVSISLPGYQQSLIRAVVVNPGETTLVETELVPNEVTLTVESERSNTLARIYDDNGYNFIYGSTPRSSAMTPGTYNYYFHSGGVEVEGTFEIPIGEDYTLTPDWDSGTPAEADIQFDSTPEGATVTIAGTVYGTTPVTVSLPVDTYDYELSLSGYETTTGQVSSVQGQTTNVNEVLLQVEQIYPAYVHAMRGGVSATLFKVNGAWQNIWSGGVIMDLNLTAGNYFYKVTDENGTSRNVSFTVPPGLSHQIVW